MRVTVAAFVLLVGCAADEVEPTPMVVSADVEAVDMVAVGGALFVVEADGSIWSMAVDGTDKRLLVAPESGAFATGTGYHLAFDASNQGLFWTRTSPPAVWYGLLRGDRFGDELVNVVQLASTDGEIRGLVEYRDEGCWIESSRVACVTYDGQVRALAGDVENGRALTTDRDSVIWLEAGASPRTRAGRVRRAYVENGSVETLVKELDEPRNLVVESDQLYWLDEGIGYGGAHLGWFDLDNHVSLLNTFDGVGRGITADGGRVFFAADGGLQECCGVGAEHQLVASPLVATCTAMAQYRTWGNIAAGTLFCATPSLGITSFDYDATR